MPGFGVSAGCCVVAAVIESFHQGDMAGFGGAGRFAIAAIIKRFHQGDMALEILFTLLNVVAAVIERLHQRDVAGFSVFSGRFAIATVVKRFHQGHMAFEILFTFQIIVAAVVKGLHQRDVTFEILLARAGRRLRRRSLQHLFRIRQRVGADHIEGRHHNATDHEADLVGSGHVRRERR